MLPQVNVSGGSVTEAENDRRRILSREAINAFDSGHRMGTASATSSSSSYPMVPNSTGRAHIQQAQLPDMCVRAAPQPVHQMPNNSNTQTQGLLKTPLPQQNLLSGLPYINTDRDRRRIGQAGRLKIPTPPVVSEQVERAMRHYQPEVT